jgi:hypothetical protein
MESEMVFTPIDKGAGGLGNRGSAAGVRLGMSNARVIYISVPRSVIQSAGWQVDWDERQFKTSVLLHEGSGTDAGFLVLAPAKQGEGYPLKAVSQLPNAAFIGHFTAGKLRHYMLPPNTVSMRAHNVDYSVDGEQLLIQVPPWLIYNSSLDGVSNPAPPRDPDPPPAPPSGSNGHDHDPPAEAPLAAPNGELDKAAEDRAFDRFVNAVSGLGLNRDQRRRLAAIIKSGR